MSKPPTKEKPKTISILNVIRTRRFIRIRYRHGDDIHNVRSNDNPLASFGKSLDVLAPVFCAVCELPEAWGKGVWVKGFDVGDLRDAKTVKIRIQKGVALSGKMVEVPSPPALLSTPKTEGGITQPLSAENAELVETAIEEAKRYVKGDRAQGVLSLDDDDDDTEDFSDEAPGKQPAPQTNELPFPGGSAGKPARRKKSPGTKAGSRAD